MTAAEEQEMTEKERDDTKREVFKFKAKPDEPDSEDQKRKRGAKEDEPDTKGQGWRI